MTTPAPGEPLSQADVYKVARLARLSITEEQARLYQTQLSAVLGYMTRLRGLDLSGTEPMVHVGETTNRLDDDIPGTTLGQQTVMNLAPDTHPPFIKVPPVFDEGSS